jgi:hypothetical protein
MRAKKIYENINFERGKDPKNVMDLGSPFFRIRSKIESIILPFGFKLSMDSNDNGRGGIKKQVIWTSGIYNQKRVVLTEPVNDTIWSKIERNDNKVYHDFREESKENFNDFRESFYKMMKINMVNRIYESINFERGKDLDIGLKHKKYPKRGDIIFVWNKVKNEWQRMESVINPHEEFTTTYERPDWIMSVKDPDGSWTLEATVIWNEDKNQWEYLSQLRESNFERGQNLKKSMKIGIFEDIKNKWELIQQSQGIGSIGMDKMADGEWNISFHVNKFPGSIYRVKEVVKEYLDSYVKEPWFAISTLYYPIKEEYQKTFVDVYNDRYPDWTIEY